MDFQVTNCYKPEPDFTDQDLERRRLLVQNYGAKLTWNYICNSSHISPIYQNLAKSR